MIGVPRIVMALILAAVLAAAALVAFDRGGAADHDRRAAEFQRLVGGVGFGPTIELDSGEAWFDPRLDAPMANESDGNRDELMPEHSQLDPVVEFPLPAPWSNQRAMSNAPPH